jgi:hypothetical protein
MFCAYRFIPDSDFFHHTFCTVRTVHTVCLSFTLVVNPLLATIAHHIFSSVLAEPQHRRNVHSGDSGDYGTIYMAFLDGDWRRNGP